MISVNPTLRHSLLVLLAAGFVFFLNLGGPALWDEDEPKNAECGREMLVRNDWIVPTFNNQLRTDKPILIYWFMLSAYNLFGVGEFAARFTSAMLSTLTVLMTWQLGRLLFRSQVGVWAGVILASCLMFGASSRAATTDATLVCFTTASLLAFVSGVRKLGLLDTSSRDGITVNLAERPALPWSSVLGISVAIGLAILAKGPSGMVLPVGIMGLFLLAVMTEPVGEVERATTWRGMLRNAFLRTLQILLPTRLWTATRMFRPLVGFVIIAAVALPWYIAVGLQTDWEWVAGFLGKHNVDRFLKPMEGHSGPVVYYIPAVLAGFFPWSVLLPLGLKRTIVRLRGTGLARSDLFLLCWAGVYVVFFSFARTKLPSYVLPCYPALALMVGRLIDSWISQTEDIPERDIRWPLAIASTAGGLFCIAVPVVAYYLLPGEYLLGAFGLIPLVGYGVALLLQRRQQRQRSMVAFGATSVLFAGLLLGVASQRVDTFQTSETLAGRVHAQSPGSSRVATLDCFQPSLVYYLRHVVTDLATAEQAAAFLKSSPDAYLVTRGEQLDKLRPLLPPGIGVIERRRMFLRTKPEVVLVGRQREVMALREIPDGRMTR